MASAALLIAIGVLAGGLFAMQWQDIQWRKTLCLSNMRRLGTALLLYSQDHDARFPIPQYQTPDGGWKPWTLALQAYYDEQRVLTCPANRAIGAIDPYRGFPYQVGYALNLRFYGVFAPGPFPLENLEIAPQTALLVESGKVHPDGPFTERTHPWALPWYWDTAWWPGAYPSPHNERMNIVAADGHAITTVVAHYKPEGHDAMYGRLGKDVYNWNAGHPNGQTDGAPRE